VRSLYNIIDAHIHLDHYKENDILKIVDGSENIEALISVSFNLESSKSNLALANQFPKVKPAFGFHPEQSLPSEKELDELLSWILIHQKSMVAVGEVGLPYYRRKKGEVSPRQYGQHLELLETFVKLAKELDKPIVLHAVYDDAPIVCELLEKYSIEKAHFHWFKGDTKTVSRMIQNGYYVSVTPDITYKEKIQQLVKAYPLQQMMVETDGPWPFEGTFEGQATHPSMMYESIKTIARLKKLPVDEVGLKIYLNSQRFYSI
jgi:TatD DNase family protein